MKVQNSPVNVSGLDATRIDKVDLKSKNQTRESALSEEMASAAKVDLSQRAQDMKKIKELAVSAPEVNAERVAHFQKLIDEGKYKVDAKAVADRMVDEHLLLGE